MMDKEKLPLGTIVKLVGRDDKYVIAGLNVNNNEYSFDYLCLRFPLGYFENTNYVFVNDDSVESVCFLGDINYQ